MPLDDDVHRYLRARAALGAPAAWQVSLEQARRADRSDHLAGGDPTPVARVTTRAIPGPAGDLGVRVYEPEGPGPHPLLAYFHGGGFVFGDLDTHDEAARRFCRGASCVVVAVDYRRAPEAPFPAAVEDVLAATRWAAAHAPELAADPERLVVAGDSAGGNLAAVVARRLRDEGGPQLAGQLLVYPVTDMRVGDYPSRRQNAVGFGLSQEAMSWFGSMYVTQPEDLVHPDASPIVAERLDGLPPAFVLTAEYDPLRDEGDLYARRLREAGVGVEHHLLPGTIHGILTNPVEFVSGRRAWALALSWLRRIVGTESARNDPAEAPR